jgi:transcriptional regulator with XRE-family HTH domain
MSVAADIMSRASQQHPLPLPIRRALRELAADVQSWRKLRGLTQAQLADRAGVGRDTVIRLEKGDGAVRLEILLRVLHALGVLDGLAPALDPYETDLGRLRAQERLPARVRPRDLTGDVRGTGGAQGTGGSSGTGDARGGGERG